MADQEQKSKPTRSNADWERIEQDYRAGVKSLREIAGEHGITEGAIRKKAKKDSWERDLAEKIQQRAEALVRNEEVRKQVRTEEAAHRKTTERQIIEANAEAVANVKSAHRRDIGRARSIVNALFDELEGMVGDEKVALLEQLGEMMFNPDQYGKDKLNDLYHQIISLPGRSKAMKDLTASLQSLVGLERTAYGMDDKQQVVSGGVVKDMTDAERAVRLANVLSKNPAALAVLAVSQKACEA